MPEVSLKLLPTVDVEKTPSLNEAGISACNFIRFRSKLPEKYGGWQKFNATQVRGTPRALHAWADLEDTNHLASGSTGQLAIITNGMFSDITPQQITTNPTCDFTTTIGSPVVTVIDPGISNVTDLDTVFFNTPVSIDGIILSGMYAITTFISLHSYQIIASTNAVAGVSDGGAVPIFDSTSGSAGISVTLPAHGLSVDSFVVFQIPTVIAGVTVLGQYKVSSITSVNVFVITVTQQANATTTVHMNSSDAQLVYYINLGPPAAGVGWGIGTYGSGTYGVGIVPSAQVGIPITTLNWQLDNWGEILMTNPQGGAIYYFPASGSISAVGHVPGGLSIAANLPSGPTFNNGMFVAGSVQILVAWGSSTDQRQFGGIGEQQDPLLVRWSDQSDFTQWTVTALTQAGSYHIPTGSRIVGGMMAPQQALIWTDIDLYSMIYEGPPFVFGFNQIGSGCGLIGPHAAAQLRGITFWMSQGNFFMLTGSGVQPIPCSVWDRVFQNLDTTNAYKCTAGANSNFDEIRWDFPSLSGGTGEPDQWVKFNLEENSWDYGYNTAGISGARSAWIDSSVLGPPIAAAPDTRLIYQHEMTMNADGQPIPSFIQTGNFALSEGQSLAFIDWILPDFKFGTSGGSTNAVINLTLSAADYANQTPHTYGPMTITSSTLYNNCRIRGRLMNMLISCSNLDSFWRLGNTRARIAQDGRR